MSHAQHAIEPSDLHARASWKSNIGIGSER